MAFKRASLLPQLENIRTHAPRMDECAVINRSGMSFAEHKLVMGLIRFFRVIPHLAEKKHGEYIRTGQAACRMSASRRGRHHEAVSAQRCRDCFECWFHVRSSAVSSRILLIYLGFLLKGVRSHV